MGEVFAWKGLGSPRAGSVAGGRVRVGSRVTRASSAAEVPSGSLTSGSEAAWKCGPGFWKPRLGQLPRSRAGAGLGPSGPVFHI